jgi:hypothetical protein
LNLSSNNRWICSGVVAGMTPPFRQPPARLGAISMHGGVSSSKAGPCGRRQLRVRPPAWNDRAPLPTKSSVLCVTGPGSSAVDVAASPPAVRRWRELAFQQHEAPDAGSAEMDRLPWKLRSPYRRNVVLRRARAVTSGQPRLVRIASDLTVRRRSRTGAPSTVPSKLLAQVGYPPLAAAQLAQRRHSRHR